MLPAAKARPRFGFFCAGTVELVVGRGGGAIEVVGDEGGGDATEVVGVAGSVDVEQACEDESKLEVAGSVDQACEEESLEVEVKFQ